MTKRIAIIGLGMAVTPHAKGLVDLADKVEVAYAITPSAPRRAAFGTRFDFPLRDSFDTILDDATVDAVAIFTPANTHLDIASRCAAAGKHVLLEKPIETSTEKAEQLVRTCRDAGVTLGIADGPTEVHKDTLARQILKGYEPAEGLFPSDHLPTRRAAAEQKYAEVLEHFLANQ